MATRIADRHHNERMDMRKSLHASLCVTVAAIGMLCQEPGSPPAPNPVLPGFHPDPSMCRVGDDYYMVNSTFEYFPGVPVSHSKDLVHWRLIGHCLTRESQLNLHGVQASGGIFAPTIRYHKGTFYVVTTCVDCGGNFFVTAADPAGPWSDPVWLDREGFDPSLFFDDDGTVYYSRHMSGGNGYIGMSILNLATGKLDGEVRKIWAGTGGSCPEGPHLYKIYGIYYLMIAEGGTDYYHSVTIARGDSPWGPFVPCPRNPILTHRHLPENPIQAVGHADMVETPAGWWLVCLGIRPQGGRFHHIGRETFLAPVVFDDAGWPVVNGNGTIPFEITAPKLDPRPWEPTPFRDDFDASTLSLSWNHVRTPYQADYSLTERPGFLRLKGSAVGLNDRDSPAFVGRRQTDFNCAASALLDFDPKTENEEAGIVVRQNDKYHYDLGVTVRNGLRVSFFRRIIDGHLIDSFRTAPLPPGPVVLSIKATPLSYIFTCTPSSGAEETVGTALAKELSVEYIRFKDEICFTGVFFGIYATGNGSTCAGPADFDWFEYRGEDRKAD